MSTASLSSAQKARVTSAWPVSSPDSETGSPTTMRSTPRSRASPATVPGSGGSTASIGVARVPVASDTAHPILAVP